MRAYRTILSLPGAALFSATALFSRLPSSMTALGIVLLVHERTGQYGAGGRVVAAYVLALAVGAPLQGRLADRWGQCRVLWVAGAGFAAGLTGLLAAVELGAHAPWTYVTAAVAGITTPQTGAMVRSRWTHALRDDRDRLPTAFALAEGRQSHGSIEALASIGDPPGQSQLHVVVSHFEVSDYHSFCSMLSMNL